ATRYGKRLLAQRNGAETAPAARAQPQRPGIAGDLLAGLDAVVEAGLDVGEVDRRCQRDPALRRAADQFGHGEERLPRQRRGWIDIRAAAVGEEECPGRCTAVLRDSLRVGEREDG